MNRNLPRGSLQPALQPATTPDTRIGVTTHKPDLTEGPLPGSVPVQDRAGNLMEQARAYPSITLNSLSAESMQMAHDALSKIDSQPAGRALLEKIESLSGKGRVTIFIANADAIELVSSTHHLDRDEGTKKLFSFFAKKKADAFITWHPAKSVKLGASGAPSGHERSSDQAYVSLAHELIHAYRIVKGTYTGRTGDGVDPKTPKGKEELRAVGLGKNSKLAFSENKIRAEHGLPLRSSYPVVGERERISRDIGTTTIRPEWEDDL